MKTHLIIPDPHAHYKFHNRRAEWLGELIADLRPDTVINLGDNWDMPSLSGYDRGKRSFQGRTYKADIDSGLDFNERLWHRVKLRKKRLPRRVFLYGNHEERIARAIDSQAELEGVIGYNDLNLDYWYTDVVPYTGRTPGIISIDGVSYAHYFVSGVMGRAIGGEHPAYSLLTKEYQSCTQGHIHVADHSIRTRADGKRIHGTVAGVFQDYDTDWAGEVNRLWWRGVVIKRNVEEGNYDIEWVSIERLKKLYG
jgi:hypothetical protein